MAWGVCARITAGVLGHRLIGYFTPKHGGMYYEVQGAQDPVQLGTDR